MRARCLAIAWRVIGRLAARSVTVAGPSVARAARMARRVGSARATKTCSATASMSGSIEMLHQLGQLTRPAVAVRFVRLAPDVDGQLGEAGLRDAKQCAVAGGLQGELDVGAARVVRGQVRQAPRVGEHGRLPTRSTRISTVMPPAKVIDAAPPGRRSIVARSPNQALNPSAVVRAGP